MAGQTPAGHRSSKLETLQKLRFGERVAEDERTELTNYFVETDYWDRIYAGDVDVIYGAKGTGKSAIYSLLLNRQDALFDRGIMVVAAENPVGEPVFKNITASPPESELAFTDLWKLYFLLLVGRQFREFGIGNSAGRRVVELLEEAELLPTETTLKGLLRAGVDYVKNLLRFESVEGGVEYDSATGNPKFSGKLTFREPTTAQREMGFLSADQAFQLANQALQTSNFEVWIALDRLDVAFAEHKDLERMALRSLFRAYSDLKSFENIGLKIFIRDDIWRRISEGGFREASHITKHVTITWERLTLMNLVMKRLLQNQMIRECYGVSKEEILKDIEKQKGLFLRVLPDQVDSGPKNPDTFGWLLGRTRDGSGKTAPRELLHLLTVAREVQLKKLEIGEAEPSGELLFNRGAFKEALPEVSRVRLHQTLYAEYPELKPYVEQLEREKAEQTPENLMLIWKVDRDGALKVAGSLVEAGFFERRGDKEKPTFWVPFLYRDSLQLVQGLVDPE